MNPNEDHYGPLKAAGLALLLTAIAVIILLVCNQ
jgi:hypothetical protein